MSQQVKHLTDEADVGSGQKSPGQVDVERDELSLGRNGDGNSPEGRMMQSGTHLARLTVQAQSDGTFEAQVYVRLTREPEVAETYIPAGTYATEPEAWAAAEERARRAFDEHEF